MNPSLKSTKRPISILSIGSEILDGRIIDSNASFLSAKLAQAGYPVSRILSCTDDLDEIQDAIEYLFCVSDTIICCGGLGPTSDDLSREAVAQYTKKPLVLNEECFSQIKSFFKGRNIPLPDTNKKQAMFPQSATILKNPIGTAAGFLLQINKKNIFCLPGVPREFKQMINEVIWPYIKKLHPDASPPTSHVLRIFGLSESKIGQVIEASKLSDDISISYRPSFPENIVQISTNEEYCDLLSSVKRIKAAIGEDYVFSECMDVNFEAALHEILTQAKLKVAVAESCTGGLIGKLLTNCPGSSTYFSGGVVTYSNESKTKMLGVDADLIEEEGAVSEKVASAMAEGARKSFNADIAISTTGIAGPEGGGIDKPVGTFYVGFSDNKKTSAKKHFFSSSRDRVRTWAAYTALDTLRRYFI